MMIWGKVIGALLGLALGHGGFMGFVIGLLLGHWADGWIERHFSKAHKQRRQYLEARQEVFTQSVVNLAAKLAKADGAVSRAEVDAFKTAFNIRPERAKEIGALYDEAKQDPSGYEVHARNLAQAFADSPLMLVEVLFALHRIALADGVLHPAERQFLETVASIFGFAGQPFGNEAPPSSASTQGDPYAVLGVSRDAPMPDIKAVWRKLTREHHPDAMMAKGAPKEMIDRATERMAAINAAYDRIRAERGET